MIGSATYFAHAYVILETPQLWEGVIAMTALGWLFPSRRSACEYAEANPNFAERLPPVPGASTHDGDAGDDVRSDCDNGENIGATPDLRGQDAHVSGAHEPVDICHCPAVLAGLVLTDRLLYVLTFADRSSANMAHRSMDSLEVLSPGIAPAAPGRPSPSPRGYGAVPAVSYAVKHAIPVAHIHRLFVGTLASAPAPPSPAAVVLEVATVPGPLAVFVPVTGTTYDNTAVPEIVAELKAAAVGARISEVSEYTAAMARADTAAQHEASESPAPSLLLELSPQRQGIAQYGAGSPTFGSASPVMGRSTSLSRFSRRGRGGEDEHSRCQLDEASARMAILEGEAARRLTALTAFWALLYRLSRLHHQRDIEAITDVHTSVQGHPALPGPAAKIALEEGHVLPPASSDALRIIDEHERIVRTRMGRFFTETKKEVLDRSRRIEWGLYTAKHKDYIARVTADAKEKARAAGHFQRQAGDLRNENERLLAEIETLRQREAAVVERARRREEALQQQLSRVSTRLFSLDPDERHVEGAESPVDFGAGSPSPSFADVPPPLTSVRSKRNFSIFGT